MLTPKTADISRGVLSSSDKEALQLRFKNIRKQTETLCEPLKYDDHLVQTADFVSPPKWHLAHTTWFFETFLLEAFFPAYKVFDPHFAYLFNSYYQTVGPFHARPQRGFLSRPTLEVVRAYRKHVTDHVVHLLSMDLGENLDKVCRLLELGVNHEEQHQELLMMDIKHIFYSNPTQPAYVEIKEPTTSKTAKPIEWVDFDIGMTEIGASEEGFSFDNERPIHSEYVAPFKLANRLVTNGEYLEFMEAGAYQKPELWLSDGWEELCQSNMRAPLYWKPDEKKWWLMTLGGVKPLNEAEPVCHLSYFEAQAYARWAGKRLPTELELETATKQTPLKGNFLEDQKFHPTPIGQDKAPVAQLYGDVWEWTQSAYLPYRGYRPVEGALGEYNGKFMCNQFVVKGGCCVTPREHIRPTYRNFFNPAMQWQFSGLRLAS